MNKQFELIQPLEQEHPYETDRSDQRLSSSGIESQLNQGDSPWADEEALRLVQLLFLSRSQESPRVVTFAGIDHGSGCSRIVASVAIALGKTLRRPVCLVEANFRSPGLPAMFETTNHFGLTDCLLRKGPISTFVKPVGGGNLSLLSAGMLAPDSANLLGSERLRERISELRAEFDFILIDSPPLTRYSDAVVLGQLSDGLVLVVEAASTRREAAAVATSNLRASKVNILAAALNKRTYPIPGRIYDLL